MSKTVQVIIAIAVILVLILGTSIFSKMVLTKSSKELENYITQIENSVRSENWNETEHAISKIENKWAQTQKLWAMLIDHIEIDNINSAMSRMTSLLELREKNMALSEAQVLKQFFKHIPDKTAFNLENIF